MKVYDLKEKGDVSTDEPLDTDIGVDGSWQKRGHNSLLNGIVTGVARGNKKVIYHKV